MSASCGCERVKSSTDIGAILGTSARAVDEHIAEICGKLGVRRIRTQAVAMAIGRGLVPTSTPESYAG